MSAAAPGTVPEGPLSPRAILFDAMGTLLELEPPAPRLRAELARRFGVALGGRACERAIAAEISYYRAHLDEGRDRDSLTGLRRRCAEALRAALPPTRELAAVDTAGLTQALLDSLRFGRFADAVPTLAALRRGGHRLVVVSNWDASLPDLLGRLELAPLLDGSVTSAEAGARKPDAAIFTRALALVGVEPAAAIHVGDSVEEDVVGARNAGIEPVLLRRDGGTGPPGVRTIASLTELSVQPGAREYR